MIIIGIDPGITGAIGAIDKDGQLLRCEDMPTCIRNYKRVVSAVGLTDLIEAILKSTDEPFNAHIVALEHVHSMPKDGVVGAFSFGDTFGSIRTVVELWGLEISYVQPRVWKKHFGLSSDKKLSVDLACSMFPNSEKYFYGPKGGAKPDRAEACLIAKYLQSQLKNEVLT